MDGLMENPIKMDDLGVPLFSETSKWSSHFRSIFSGTHGHDGPIFQPRQFVGWGHGSQKEGNLAHQAASAR